jgi:uncharacterized protein
MEDQQPQIFPEEAVDQTSVVPPTFVERHGISLIIFTFVSLILIFFLYQIVGGVLTYLIFGMQLNVENTTGYRIATGIGQLLFILIPTVFLVRLVAHRPAEYLRFKAPTFSTVLAALVGIFSLQQVLQVYLVFQEKIPLPPELQSIIQQFKDMFDKLYKQLVGAQTTGELLFVLIIVAVIPAITEELMFRGLIQRNLEKAVSPVRGMIITSVIFAGYHLNPFSFIPLVAIGMYLGFLALRSGSIWISMIGHFANNAIAVLALFAQVPDDNVVFGNSSEMSLPGLLVTFWFFGLLFILSTLYFVKITRQVHPSPATE